MLNLNREDSKTVTRVARAEAKIMELLTSERDWGDGQRCYSRLSASEREAALLRCMQSIRKARRASAKKPRKKPAAK